MRAFSERQMFEIVVDPLLRSWGHSESSFTGGPYEKGKDFVAWRPDEVDGIPRLTVGQIKMQRLSANVSRANGSFATLIAQLLQAAETEVPHANGTRSRPAKIYVVTPHELDTRTLESQPGWPRLVSFIHAENLPRLLRKHVPAVITQLLGPRAALGQRMLPEDGNPALLAALNAVGTHPSIGDVYCDLEFAIGKNTSQMFFDVDLTRAGATLSVDRARWPAVRDKVRALENAFKKVLTTSLEEVEERYDKARGQRDTPANRRRAEEVQRLEAEHHGLEEDRSALGKRLRDLVQDPVRYRNHFHDAIHEPLDELAESLTAQSLDAAGLRSAKAACSGLLKKATRAASPGVSLLDEIAQLLARVAEVDAKRATAKAGLLPQPCFELAFDTALLQKRIAIHRTWIEGRIRDFNKKLPTSFELREFLTQAHTCFTSVDQMLADPALFDAEAAAPAQRYIDIERLPRMKLPAHDVFDSFEKVWLLGEAGAGKSTTLIEYARRLLQDPDVVALYVPLARLGDRARPDREEAQPENPGDHLLQAIVRYLQSYYPAMSAALLAERISDAQRAVLILDGLDEIIGRWPWMVQALEALGTRFPRAQMIVSSRMSGEYLRPLTAFSLTLMPFTPAQRDAFIEKWFGADDSVRAQATLGHLRHASHTALAAVVTNPLLATVLCVLAKRGIPLPKTEIGLYDERVRLLLGDYDGHKGVQRLRTSRDVLEKCARKLAFHLLEKQIRSAGIEELTQILTQGGSRGMSRPDAAQAVQELLDPCNVLVPMTEKGEIGFGPLRYQEHLAACELRSEPGTEIAPFLSKDWWRDTMVLLVKMIDSGTGLIERVVKDADGVLGRMERTVGAMIDALPDDERDRMLQMIAQDAKLRDREARRDWDSKAARARKPRRSRTGRTISG